MRGRNHASMIFEEYIPLAPFTTFKIGGKARYFCRVKSAAELAEALQYAKENRLPFFVLGGGSNLLIDDAGFPGLVIKVEIHGIEFRKNADGTMNADAGAGEDWDEFVAETVRRGLSGVENLSLIPGTVGAAPVQNIGAYGVEAKDTVHSVEVLNTETGKVDVIPAAQCYFAYRDSIFKHAEGKKYIITRVRFTLREGAPLQINYRDVTEFFQKKGVAAPTLQQVRDAIVAIRTAKLPDLSRFGTAGSFFKNPIISRADYEKLLARYPGLPSFPAEPLTVKVPAAWILDNICGWKGHTEGTVGVYQNQALVLVNTGGGTSAEIDALAKKMQDSVLEKTGIVLEREVIAVS